MNGECWVGQVQWGDVGTWFSGAFTAAAVVVALLQGRRARQTAQEAHGIALRAQERADEDAAAREEIRQDELANQARLVTTRVGAGHPTSWARVLNASEEPIFALTLESAYLTGPRQPHDYEYRVLGRYSAATLTAGTEFEFEVEFREPGAQRPLMVTDMDVSIDVSFVDKHGVRWRRWNNVQPRRDAVAPAVHREPPPPKNRY
ncbi:hypothetical protein [Phycicoccus avicenniae]|uniref:hypothetical protein n=1 Tax=Phycicoccus avicenniae TaxID=2828860 RepID=UPI003D2AF6A6